MTHVLQLRAQQQVARDTLVDVPVLRRRRRVRRRAQSEVREAAEAQETIEAPAPVAPVRADSRPLWDVRLGESKGRRGHRRKSQRIDPVALGLEARPAAVRLDWVRSRDRSMRVQMLGADTVVVEGLAAGESVSGRRPVSIAVGVEGRMYSVQVEAGATAAAAAARLAQRLERGFEVELLTLDDGRPAVRLTRER